MKIIGILGGMSWESTTLYYKLINEEIRVRLGGLHSAQILLSSLDFAEIAEYQSKNQWKKSADVLMTKAKDLERGGAQCIVIATNTMHKIIPLIDKEISIPFIHIAKSLACALQKEQVDEVLLLGTRYTMKDDFYKAILNEYHIKVQVPSNEDIEYINAIIFKELCVGQIQESSRQMLLWIIKKQKCNNVALACTELPLLFDNVEEGLRFFDTGAIHAKEAVEFALGR